MDCIALCCTGFVPVLYCTRLYDDIDGLAGEEEELANLIQCLDKASTAYGMEISAQKTKLITNDTRGINTEKKIDRSLRLSQASSTWA